MTQIQERDRVLAPSRSGRYYCVLEIISTHVGLDPVQCWDWCTPEEAEEAAWESEGYECTGWFRGKNRAGRARARLERQGLWLSEESKAAMSSGAVLRVDQLVWEPAPASPAMRRD